MITRKALLLNAFVAALACYPHVSVAEGFTSADVLEWSEDSQNSFFQTSGNMIGIVATRTGNHAHIADCIDSWHGGGTESQIARANQIREMMEALPDYHPQVVIQVVIEEQCGDF